MCTISYEKCVCFVFLVILAVLSCSGFCIDNLAMTDISKRNSHTSTSLLNSDELLARLFTANSTHRIRHHRHLHPAPSFAPPTAAPRAVRTLKRNRKQCPELDASWKAYKSDAVVVAKVESKSSNCRENCTVQFRVNEWLKNRPSYEDRLLRLNFRTDRTNYCEYDDLTTNRSHHFLVRTKIDQSKEYILFLKTSGPHNYAALFVPEPNRNKTLKTVRRVNSPHFRPKPLRLERFDRGESRSKRLKLTCKVRGFPIPIIYWKRNNTLLHPNSRTRITQKKKKSTLVIRNLSAADSGQYKCVARGVDGKENAVSFPTIGRPREKPGIYTTVTDRKPCNESMRANYCSNGGTCFYVESMNEYACECANGFKGLKCDEKSSDQSRY